MPAPLIDLSILRRRGLATGLGSGMVSYLALFGTLFIVPYYLSADRESVTLIGLQLAVLPVAIGITAPIAGRLVDRVGTRAADLGRADTRRRRNARDRGRGMGRLGS